MSATVSSAAAAAAASARISLWRRSEAACTLNRHSETDLRRPVALPRRDRRRSAAPAAANAALTTAPDARRDVRRDTAAEPGPWPLECSVIVVSTTRHVIATRRQKRPEVVDRKQLWRDARRRAPARSPCWLLSTATSAGHSRLVGFPCFRCEVVVSTLAGVRYSTDMADNLINELCRCHMCWVSLRYCKQSKCAKPVQICNGN